eukprot:TRINITY_DN23870_c0_g2_i1.p1 TRINITY_DN23870_c0_g2~~TRINITY_DN23870_c0_g2_i1.p1  ORF type:complete len:221 (-),score=64.63 TRINITY_DN23870_c0_g2_i1:38-700(-)
MAAGDGSGDGAVGARLAPLLEFASAVQAAAGGGGAAALSAALGNAVISQDLDALISEVATTGVAAGYPWEALRLLLARKLSVVLAEFWKDAPDVEVKSGESFERVAVEPLTASLLEPRREGAPFTVQRLCELLSEPRSIYKSTRRFLYALQRAVLVTSTEARAAASAMALSPLSLAGEAAAAAAPAPAVSPEAEEGIGGGGGKKRKLSPGRADGVVASSS